MVPHPTWLAYGFAVVMVAVSLYCIARVAAARRLGRRNHHDVSLAHVLMGFGMAGMLVPRWRVLPVGVWEALFGAVACYFLAASLRFVVRHGLRGRDDDQVHHLSHYVVHLFMAGVMVYMYWLASAAAPSTATTASMSGPPLGAGDPSFTLLFVGILLASAVWQLDSISRFASVLVSSGSTARGGTAGGVLATTSPGSTPTPWLAPRLEIGCHVAMCVAMAYMLVLMI